MTCKFSHSIVVSGLLPSDNDEETGIVPKLLSLSSEGLELSFKEDEITVNLSSLGSLGEIAGILEGRQYRVFKLESVPKSDSGDGRIKRLEKTISLKEAIEITKQHLELENVRFALAKGKHIGKF